MCLLKQVEKTKKHLNKLALAFITHLNPEEDYDNYYYWVWDDVWWILCVSDMFFSVEDIFLRSEFTSDQIHVLYWVYTETNQDWFKINLKNFLEYYKNIEDNYIISPTKKEFNPRKIKCLHTDEILYSKQPWHFAQSSDWSCFIDQDEFIYRVGWIEWKDFIYIK